MRSASDRSQPFCPSLRPGLLYFALVFAAGFLLGTVRELFVAPILGARAAELAETPLMLIAIVLSSRLVLARCAMGPSRAMRLRIGAIGLLLLLAFELTLVRALRGLTLGEAILERDPVTGGVHAASLIFMLLAPVLFGRRSD